MIRVKDIHTIKTIISPIARTYGVKRVYLFDSYAKVTTEGLEASEKGLLITDENGMTTRAGVFAAGDVVHGPKTVVHAVEAAKKAAAAMMKYMES